MTIQLLTAPGCAWRAVYLYVNGRQYFHLGYDPGDNNYEAAVFSTLGRIRVGFLSWPTATKYQRLGALVLYRLCNRIRWALRGADWCRGAR